MKKRIAKGSGTTVNDVNRVISQFEKTKKAMDTVGMMQKKGSLTEENLEKMLSDAEQQFKRN